MRAATRRALGGEHLGQHASAAEVAANAACHVLKRGVGGVGFGYKFGVIEAARVFRVQARLIGENDQHVSFDEVGDQCRERIVVAETYFVGCYRIVFIDDGHDTEFDQRAQCRARVEIALSVR